MFSSSPVERSHLRQSQAADSGRGSMDFLILKYQPLAFQQEQASPETAANTLYPPWVSSRRLAAALETGPQAYLHCPHPSVLPHWATGSLWMNGWSLGAVIHSLINPEFQKKSFQKTDIGKRINLQFSLIGERKKPWPAYNI